MTVRVDLEDGVIALRTSPTDAPRAKEIPGGRYDSKNRRWTFPLGLATCVVARGVFGSELEIGPELNEWAAGEFARAKDALDVRAGTKQVVLDSLDSRLFDFQRADVAFVDAAGSALISNEMGTGKTVEAVSILELADSYPALIVAPNGVKRVWAKAFEEWAPRRVVEIAPPGTAQAEDAVAEVLNGGADVLVVSWDALKSLSRLAPFGSIRLEPCSNCDPTSRRKPSQCQREDKSLNMIRWAAVVADEAHRAKNPKALWTRALWALGDRAERRIALTGTPIANSPEDLWSVMRFVAPNEYPSKWTWINRYAQTVPNLFSGGVDVIGLRPDRREELDRFFQPRFVRRTKAEVLPDLPPKLYERREVHLTGKQLKAYQAMEKEMVAQIEGGTLVATNGLVAAMRLRQLASAYGEVISASDWQGLSLDDPDALARTIDQQVVLSEPSSKLDELEEVLEELGGRQAVIFAESAQLIKLAARRLPQGSYGLIIGETPEAERAGIVEGFQAGAIRYVLATVAAGGEGISLTAADTAIFLQRPWSAVLNRQAEDRLHRIGQTAQSVTYVDLVAVDTVEEKVFDALRRKEQMLKEVVGE